jgi:hypothetical protein
VTTPSPACPSCGGAYLPLHPSGALTFQHRPGACSLGAAQDQTQNADAERLSDPLGPASIERPPTPAEVTLARHLGIATGLDAVVVRRVTSSAAVRRRDPIPTKETTV